MVLLPPGKGLETTVLLFTGRGLVLVDHGISTPVQGPCVKDATNIFQKFGQSFIHKKHRILEN